MERTDYDKQATDFLTTHHLTLVSAFKGDRCPPWAKGEHTTGNTYRDTCPECGTTHGDRYRVTIKRTSPKGSLSFDFWGSKHDQQNGARPSAYDVLACISSDVYCPETFKDFCSEYGYDEDSRQAEATFRRCSQFATRLRAFFAEAELEALSEIR